jgi:hypothetical protein
LRKLYESLLALLMLTLVISFSVSSVRAQDIGITAEIHPSSGTANTEIVIRFLTTNASVGNVEKADIFWDDVSVELNESGVQGADGSYNYFLKVPTEPPLSDVGNHTIRVDSLVLNYGQASFNFTFAITEYVPSPEYVALNATYYALVANYSNLRSSYDSLLANYSTLLADEARLLSEHDALLSNYNSLSANYNSLLADYNALTANYNSLLINYNNLYNLYSIFRANYTSLLGSFDSLSSNYNGLRTDYDSLESNYRGLKTSYDNSLGELALTRDVLYVFVASTIVFVATTLYFALRKLKLPVRSR